MNDKEKKAFEHCMKHIKRLLIEEKQTKAKLERIQRDKLGCVRLLLDDEYCKKVGVSDVED